MYIAHIRETDKAEQSVKAHCENTARLAAGYAEDSGLSALAKLAGTAHDFGKLCGDFSTYIKGDSKFGRGEIDHAYAGARYVCELAKKAENKNALRAAELAAHAVISHHGLHDWVTGDGEDYFAERSSKNERYDEITAAVRKEFSEEQLLQLLEKAGEEYSVLFKKLKSLAESVSSDKKDRQTALAFYMGMAERLLESCIVDADRTDTADFMEGKKSPEEPDRDELWQEVEQRLSDRLSKFAVKTDRISVQRTSISDRCAAFAEHSVGAVRLVVPTGGGKTLASLRFAVEYCRRNGMKKIIYTAPFMSILEQNSDELRKLAGEENFLEHHSNIFAELNGKEELNKYELLSERWTSPVIATTMVQLLNALFSGKMSALRRMHRLSRAVIIVDEIQSLPLKCVYMFNLAVNFLTSVCGCAVILCSATQPQLDNVAFPLKLDELSSMTGDYTEDFELFRRTRAIPLLKNGGYSYEEAAEICMEKFRENGNLLLIVNTKAAAAEMFRLLSERSGCEEEPVELVHLSTNMCADHRRKEIERMRSLLGKRPVICVTTQLIEAGVDVSFRCVVRSLAGLDNAAQAAGRCNRNGESECRNVYIIELGEEKLTNLADVMKAQNCSRRVIESGAFDDILSPEALSEYFGMYYSEQRKALSYNVMDGSVKDTLLELLSLNKNRVEISRLKSGAHNQAFETAGKEFKVIDSETTDILVPYDDAARKLISDLNGELSISELLEKQRTAQKYTVSVYSGMKRALEKSDGIYLLRSGAYAAKDGFYNEHTGLTAEGESNEELFF